MNRMEFGAIENHENYHQNQHTLKDPGGEALFVENRVYLCYHLPLCTRLES